MREVGHPFGLDDWTPTGQCRFLMKAGSASQITEFDKWMLRDFRRHLESRYGYWTRTVPRSSAAGESDDQFDELPDDIADAFGMR